jgi:hypothetical protein
MEKRVGQELILIVLCHSTRKLQNPFKGEGKCKALVLDVNGCSHNSAQHEQMLSRTVLDMNGCTHQQCST